MFRKAWKAPRSPRSWGPDAAAKLSRHHGRNYLAIPLAKEWRAACYAASGLSQAQIALKLGSTESGVRRLLIRGQREDGGGIATKEAAE